MEGEFILLFLIAAIAMAAIFTPVLVATIKRKKVGERQGQTARIITLSITGLLFAVSLISAVYLMVYKLPKRYYLDKAQKEFDEAEYKTKIERILEEKYYFGGAYSGYYYDVTDVEFVYTFDEKPRVFIVTYTSDGGRKEKPEAEEKYETRWAVGFIYRDKPYMSLLGEYWEETPLHGSDDENPFIKYGAQDKKKYYFGFNGFGYLNDEGKIIGVNGEFENKEIPEDGGEDFRPYIVNYYVYELKE